MGFAFSQHLAEFGCRTLIDVRAGSKRNDLHRGTDDAIDDSRPGYPVTSQACQFFAQLLSAIAVISNCSQCSFDFCFQLRREMADEIPQHPRHLNAITDHFDRLRGLKGSPKTSSNVNRRPFSSCRKPCLISFIRARLRMISLVSRQPSYSSALMRTAAGRPFRVMTSSSSSFSQSATNRLRWALASDKLRTRAIVVS